MATCQSYSFRWNFTTHPCYFTSPVLKLQEQGVQTSFWKERERERESEGEQEREVLCSCVPVKVVFMAWRRHWGATECPHSRGYLRADLFTVNTLAGRLLLLLLPVMKTKWHRVHNWREQTHEQHNLNVKSFKIVKPSRNYRVSNLVRTFFPVNNQKQQQRLCWKYRPEGINLMQQNIWRLKLKTQFPINFTVWMRFKMAWSVLHLGSAYWMLIKGAFCSCRCSRTGASQRSSSYTGTDSRLRQVFETFPKDY